MSNKKYWYGLKKDGSQCRATDEQMKDYINNGKIMKLNVMWTDTAVLEDGTRLAKTKKAAQDADWPDIAKAPFDFK